MDPLMGAALIGGGLNLAGGLIGNQNSSDEATWARDHSAWQARESRDWQNYMASTAYQRTTADMQAAGLNPMLAYSQGATPSPGGAMGQSPMAQQRNPFEGVNASTAAQIALTKAQTEKTKAETEEIAPTARMGREYTGHQSANIRQQIGESAMRIEKIISETAHHDASASQVRQQETNLRKMIPHIEESVRLLRAQTTQTGTLTNEAKQRIAENLPKIEANLKKLETIYKQMESPGREATHAFESGAPGAILRSIKDALKGIVPFLN